MTQFLSRWLVLTIAAGVMVALIPGMRPIGNPAIFGIAAFALFMALINASIKPFLHILSLPFTVLTFGFFALIVNWLCMELASWLAVALFGVGVAINGFWVSVVGSFIMMVVSWIVESIIGL
ncbi:phage holin family protein [Bifidobacterium bombi]|uniref:Membrane spanning protein n=1 Tax=Bifidobacterium bombi DSM 19703 TaxID=1341695 RepID=A0A080N497_9BIFI|nr:phage holin family protein [Bifidobacterium bombi]KFF31160.1 membrane spanning protein [Bifidobacterium bombi DSM 19703]